MQIKDSPLRPKLSKLALKRDFFRLNPDSPTITADGSTHYKADRRDYAIFAGVFMSDARYMDSLSRYDVIAVAYKSRLLFCTDAEYRSVLGVSFETVTNNRDSQRDTSIYYDILNRECESRVDISLRELVGDYLLASEYFLNVDWGERSQMSSRKRFCRMLFRIYATAGMELSFDEILKFKVKDGDQRLMEIFFPDGTGEAPAVEIGYLLMFAFGVMKPWSGGDGTRSRDIRPTELERSLVRLHDLLKTLCDDMPRLGSTEKPLVFHEWIEAIDSYLIDKESLTDVTPLRILSSIIDVTQACRSLATTEQRRISSERFQGYDMPGIWVDDADEGRTRFWIFPDNFLVAFCYTRHEMGWEMTPYDFRVRFAASDAYSDSFVLLDPEGNLAYTLSPDSVIDKNQFGSGGCDCEFDETTGEMVKVELYEEACKFPDWLDWRSWSRIGHDDARYQEFRAILRDLYNPDSPHSLFFRTVAPELTDCVNCLVGRDRKYLYVYDWRPERFAIRETDRDRFTYRSESCNSHWNDALFELPISENHPLYALPLQSNKANYRSKDARMLADLLKDADNITELYILHSARISHPRLVFPDHGRTVKLDMDTLQELGVRKFTLPSI